MSSGKMEMAGLEPAYPNYFIGHPIKDATYPFRPRLHNRPLTVSARIYRAMRDTNTEPFYTPFQILCGTRRNRAHTSLMSLYTAFG